MNARDQRAREHDVTIEITTEGNHGTGNGIHLAAISKRISKCRAQPKLARWCRRSSLGYLVFLHLTPLHPGL
jgi:hypothetical protein